MNSNPQGVTFKENEKGLRFPLLVRVHHYSHLGGAANTASIQLTYSIRSTALWLNDRHCCHVDVYLP